MSTGLECLFIEPTPGTWFYVLEDWDAPKNSWDWREHATSYGPFTSEDEAHDHLHSNHANPGGCMIDPYTASREPSPIMEKLIIEARK